MVCPIKECPDTDKEIYLPNCNPDKLCFMHYWAFWDKEYIISNNLGHYNLDSFKKHNNVTNTMTDFITTEQAAKMRSGINVLGEITKVSETRNVNLKAGGTVTVADATLSDESGDIGLTLWGEDIALCPVGTKVSIQNGFSNEFKGQVAITKGKYGKLEVQ